MGVFVEQKRRTHSCGELRAAMSMTRLWQQQNRHGEACELLTPIYTCFTEGFDTADLMEARSLLDELGAQGYTRGRSTVPGDT